MESITHKNGKCYQFSMKLVSGCMGAVGMVDQVGNVHPSWCIFIAVKMLYPFKKPYSFYKCVHMKMMSHKFVKQGVHVICSECLLVCFSDCTYLVRHSGLQLASELSSQQKEQILVEVAKRTFLCR